VTYLPALSPSRRPERLGFSIREITSGWDMRRVAGLHGRINRGDRFWNAPPRGATRRALVARYKTDGQNGSFGVFVAEAQSMIQADEMVGSMAVWLAGEPEAELAARFGLFEVINDSEVAEQLIEAAETWLLQQFPVAAIRGPYGLDAGQAPGLLTNGFNVRPARGLPYNPPYYPEIMECAGYAPCATTRTYILRAAASPDAPQVRVTGEIGSGVGVAWEESGAASEMLLIELEASGFPLRVGERLLRRPVPFRRGRRLLARPLGEREDSARAEQWLAVCRAVASVAARLGFDEVLLGPISDEADALSGALLELGAQPTHTYQIFEKRF
jgi:hypothetical protein